MKNLWKQVAQTSGVSVFGLVTSGLTLIITARYLGPEGRGILAAANTWLLFIATLASLSLGQVIVKEVAGKEISDWLPNIFGTVLSILGVCVFVSWGIIVFGYIVTSGQLFANIPISLLLLACLALPFLISNESGRYLLYALDALRVFNLAQLAGFACSLVLLILTVIVLGAGIPAAFFSLLLASIITSTISFLYIARRGIAYQFRWSVARRLLSGSAQLHMNAIGNFFFTQASILILNLYTTPREVSYYQLAIQLFNMALIVPVSIGTVAFGLVAKRGADGAWGEQRRLLAQGLGLALIVGIVGYLLAPWAIPLIVGPEFAPAVPLFQTLLIALIGATLSTVMASQWIGRGLLWQAAFLTLTIGVLSLATDFILIPRYGMYGALVSTLVTYSISIVGNGALGLWVEHRWSKLQPSYT